MSGVYTDETTRTRDGFLSTVMRVDGRQVCEYTSPQYTSRSDHENALLPIVEAVLASWGICPDCYGSSSACHCVEQEDLDSQLDARRERDLELAAIADGCTWPGALR